MATSLSLLKPGLKTSLAEAMYNEIVSNTSGYYYFLGKTLEWSPGDEASSPGVDQSYESQTRAEVIFFKKVTSADASLTIPRYDWITGQVFDMYDDQIGKQVVVTDCIGSTSSITIGGVFDLTQIGIGWSVSGAGVAVGTTVAGITSSQVQLSTPTTSTVSTLTFTKVAPSGATSLETSRFYCVTNENNVYKCLSNNNNSPSTSKPFATTHETVTTDDGYIWKFMYTIPGGLGNKFTTLNDIPVTTAVKAPYFSQGSITSVNIVDYGRDYELGDSLVVTGNGSLADNVYKLIAVTVVDGGFGYTAPPAISVDDPFDSVPFEAATGYLVGQYVKSSNRIYEVVQGGISGSAAPIQTSQEPVSNGTAAFKFVGISVSAVATLDDTSISSVAMSGIVGYITLTQPGVGYDPLNPPNVTISGTGTGAAAVANVSADGYLVGITMTNRGANYTAATVVVDAPPTHEIEFDPSTAVNTSTDTISFVDHQFGTGDEVVYSNGGGTSVGGLVNGLTYFIVAVDEDTIRLTSSFRDSFDAENLIDLTTGATGTEHTLTLAVQTAAATAEIYYGYGYNDVPSISVVDPFVADADWSAGGTVSEDDIIQSGTRFYQVTTEGTNTLGESFPTHTTGTQQNGNVDLEFIGSTALLAMLEEKTKALVAPVIKNGQIVDVVVQDAGIGYTIAEITAFGQGTGAVIIPNLSFGDLNSRQSNIELLSIPGTIDAIEVLSPGSGYAFANISIVGDGSGCQAEAVITQGAITKIIVTNPGSGYTKATVTITGNGGATQAYARPIVSPYNGHGQNAVKELFAKDISLATTVARDRNQGFIVSNDYRQLGIIKNPEVFNSTQRFSGFSGSACFSLTGDFLFSDLNVDDLLVDTDENQYRVVALPQDAPSPGSLLSILVQSIDNATPVSGIKLSYGSNLEATVTIVTPPTVNKYSGDLLFIDNRNSFQPTDEQTLSFKTVIRL